MKTINNYFISWYKKYHSFNNTTGEKFMNDEYNAFRSGMEFQKTEKQTITFSEYLLNYQMGTVPDPVNQVNDK